MIQHCFLDVAGRTVHYRRAGNGPPVVMLHGSPGDSQMLTAEITAAAERCTVFALDTPGFGHSDALPGETLTVPDLARATAEAMRALSLPPCPVYGTHTGAAIAMELGLGWPEQITGLVMEGLPAFTGAEIENFFTGYFAPMVPDPLGGHFFSTWMRFRDQFTWFPWTSRDVTRLNAINRPAPEDIDLWVSMFYRSCKTYRPAYRAACHYGQAAIRAASLLRLPAIYMATAEDMLFSHLDRLPPLHQGQRIERLAAADPGKIAAICKFLGEFAGGSAAPSATPALGGPRLYVQGKHGRIFARQYGDASSPALVLLHDVPGTSLALHDAAQTLADTRHVIVPDHPGCGLTEAPEGEDILTAAADSIVAVADALRVDSCDIAAPGYAAAVAASLAQRHPGRVSKIMIDTIIPPNPEHAARIAPAIELCPTGAHWTKTWLMLRDAQIYRPWFDGRIAAQRRAQGNFDAGFLHDQTVALMEGRATYFRLPRAAAAFPTAAILKDAGVPLNNLKEPGHGIDA